MDNSPSCPPSSGGWGGGSSTATVGGGSSSGPSCAAQAKNSEPLNATHIERRRLKKKYAVKRLEKKLENYNRQIKKFSEEEVSLDEMLSGSSAYLKEDYVKRKFMDTWEELCSLLKIPSNIEVAHEDKEESYATPYPEINRRVQRLLKTDAFPDYVDISELVDRCNSKHKLGISLAEKTHISEKLFKAVGKIIKCRRSRDYRAHFGSHLTDVMKMEDDPAIRDGLLLEQLQKSLDQGQRVMQSLVDDFVMKQEVELERKGGASPHGDSCDEEEDEEGGEGGGGEEEVCQVDSELSSEDESHVAKRIKLDSDAANGVSLSTQGSTGAQERGRSSPMEGETQGADERGRSSPSSGAQEKSQGSPSSGAQEESGNSSSIVMATVEDGQISSTTAAPTEIIIPDSDSDVVVISDSD